MDNKIIDKHKSIVEEIVKAKNGTLVDIFRKKKWNQNITWCKIMCKDRHVWTTRFDTLKRGSWCPKCSQRTSTEDIKKIVEPKHGTLLKDEIINGTVFITIQCNIDNNIWKTSLSNVKRGYWCKECYRRSKIKILDKREVDEFVKNSNILLLTAWPFNLWDNIKVKCTKHNHEWETSFAYLSKRHSVCKFCSFGSVDIDTLNKAIESLNATFIERIKTTDTARNIRLRCNIHNHEWKTNSGDIIKGDRICTFCARDKRKTQFEIIKMVVESKEGIIVSPEKVCGSLTKMTVRCKNGHEWETYYDNVNQGYWCPQCPFVKQTLLLDIIKNIFPNMSVENNARPFEWLKDKNKLEIDIWFPELKLAIEYDGEQHFKPIKFAATMTDKQAKDALQLIKKHDEIKNTLIQRHPDEIKYFVRFDYTEDITKEYVIEKLINAGVEILKHGPNN